MILWGSFHADIYYEEYRHNKKEAAEENFYYRVMAANLTYAYFIVETATLSKECEGVNEGSYLKCRLTPHNQKGRRIIGENHNIKMLEKIRCTHFHTIFKGDKKINQ